MIFYDLFPDFFRPEEFCEADARFRNQGNLQVLKFYTYAKKKIYKLPVRIQL